MNNSQNTFLTILGRKGGRGEREEGRGEREEGRGERGERRGERGGEERREEKSSDPRPYS